MSVITFESDYGYYAPDNTFSAAVVAYKHADGGPRLRYAVVWSAVTDRDREHENDGRALALSMILNDPLVREMLKAGDLDIPGYPEINRDVLREVVGQL